MYKDLRRWVDVWCVTYELKYVLRTGGKVLMLITHAQQLL
jgi:hypothetical protein